MKNNKIVNKLLTYKELQIYIVTLVQLEAIITFERIAANIHTVPTHTDGSSFFQALWQTGYYRCVLCYPRYIFYTRHLLQPLFFQEFLLEIVLRWSLTTLTAGSAFIRIHRGTLPFEGLPRIHLMVWILLHPHMKITLLKLRLYLQVPLI
jgi:hypothetical protein